MEKPRQTLRFQRSKTTIYLSPLLNRQVQVFRFLPDRKLRIMMHLSKVPLLVTVSKRAVMPQRRLPTKGNIRDLIKLMIQPLRYNNLVLLDMGRRKRQRPKFLFLEWRRKTIRNANLTRMGCLVRRKERAHVWVLSTRPRTLVQRKRMTATNTTVNMSNVLTSCPSRRGNLHTRHLTLAVQMTYISIPKAGDSRQHLEI